MTQAKQKVFSLLKIRFRSEKELYDKLKQKKFPDEVIVETIVYFKKNGLIDDKQFAQKWIAARMARPFGINRIRYELKNKGIADPVLQETLKEAFTGDAEEAIVSQLAQKQVAKYKNIDEEKKKERVYGFLLRRGFSQTSVLRAIKKL